MAHQEPPSDSGHRLRGAVWLAAIGVVFVALGGRVVYINSTLRADLLKVADKQQHSNSIIPARRGRIVDTRGRVVAVTRYVPDVFLDPMGSDDIVAVAEELSPRLNVPVEEIMDKVNRRPNSRFIVVARGVDEVTAEAVRAMKSAGVGLVNRPTRSYPLGRSMAHVIGFVGRDAHGLEGIELSCDDHLAGRDGQLGSIRDARRRGLWRSDDVRCEPVDGGDVVLTIDAEVQRIAEDALRRTVKKFEAESGVAVVMVPGSGEVLAMASAPDFDPNEAGEAQPDARRNRVITDPTEPGSTFKPFIASGALEAGIITTSEKINCRMGRHRFGKRLVTDTKPHGMLDLTGIITYSSNIGMATIGTRMGNGVLHETIRRFGFGERTGIRCPGESSGTVYGLRHWNSYSTTSVSFGYEVGVTPIQLTRAFCAILNGGELLRPRVVRRFLAPNGSVTASFDIPEVDRRVMSEKTATYLSQEALVSVVQRGTVKRHFPGPYRVLGKTGTAKLPYRDRSGYEPGAYVSTFMGASPAADPKLAVVVIIRRPNAKIGYYGATVAAPAVSEIISGALVYLKIPPDDALALGGANGD